MNAIAQVSAAPVSGSKLDNRRVIAAIVDLLIVTAGAAVVLIAGDSLTGDRQSALAAVILGWALYYFFALESGEGQTIGKRLMKVRVVRTDGRPAGMREIGVRTILRVIDNYLVGLIVMLATGERRQRIGDLAAGTIVVDASGPAVARPAVVPVADAEVGLEPEPESAEDEPAGMEPDPEPVATQTITLPPRPTPPATLTDLTEPEAEEDPVDDGSVAEDEPEVVAEEDPVDDGSVAEDEPEVVAEEPVHEELPAVTSPSLEELADDVAAAHVEPEVDESEADEPESGEDDGPVNVKSVETVSAMDLIMGAAEEDSAAQGSDPDAEEPSSA